MQSGLQTQWRVLNIMVMCHLDQTDGCDRTKNIAGSEHYDTQLIKKINELRKDYSAEWNQDTHIN